jgi:hypothetical protein
MLRLMTDENATQAGANPGAVMNEVAAVTRRLIAGLLSAPTIVGAPAAIKAAFDSTLAMKQAVGKLGAVIAAREQIDADLSMTCPGRFSG